MTAAISMTSMPVTASVRMSVPYGSPSFAARTSACRTTAKAETAITANSHAERNASQADRDKSSSHESPNSAKSAAVRTLATSAHSVRRKRTIDR